MTTDRAGSSLGATGAVSVWAAAGLVWLLFCAQALVRWFADDAAFGPAPILGPDVYDGWQITVLRGIEVGSLFVAAATIWVFLVKPWRRTGRVTFDGTLVIGSLSAAVIDPTINYFHYTFAWNAHAWNLGSWLGSFPLHQGPTRYGEGLVWFVPQYLYLGIGLAALGARVVTWRRSRNPLVSNARAYSDAFLVLLLIDVLIEQLFIRLGVYAFPRTWSALTLFDGSQFQFPVYESAFVAAYALGFMAARFSHAEDPGGLSFVERGLLRWQPRLRTPVRVLAACGFCSVWAATSYFIPWSWMSVTADSIVGPPSYMLPGR